MAAKNKAGEVSGFDVVRAVKMARPGQGSAPPPPGKPPAPPSSGPGPEPPDETPSPPAKIGKTAVPTKHEYVCYECGYRFTVAGKAHTLYCAKCRTILNQTDYTIDKPHDVSIVTAGTVTIEADGVWSGGSLAARDVILKGRHEGGTIKAFRKLVIHPGAGIKLSACETESLVLLEGSVLKAEAPMRLRDLELHGVFEGELEATGLVAIKAGGHFVGRLTARHLSVEDGAGLTGDLRINADPEPEAKPRIAVEKKHGLS